MRSEFERRRCQYPPVFTSRQLRDNLLKRFAHPTRHVAARHDGLVHKMNISRYKFSDQFEDIDGLMCGIRQLLVSGNYILTREVAAFEDAFAEYSGCKFARGVNSGTDALHIALRSLGVGAGDEVITQANTFHATVAAIEMAGANPVLVDATDDTFSMDTSQLASALTPKTCAIIPVHLYGKPAPMQAILEIAESRNLLVIEDAAQAHGAKIDGKPVGSFGNCGCFSFHPSKNLAAAGDAGAIVTNSRRLAENIDLYRSLGQPSQNEHVVVGLNSKLDAVQALVLHHKLSRLEAWNEARSRVSTWYRQELAGCPVTFQGQTPNETHVYHLFQLRTLRRDSLLQFLKTKGVDAVVRYPTPINLQPAFAKWRWRSGQFPVAERLAQELICLPIRPDLQRSEVAYVSDQVRSFFNQQREFSRAGAGGIGELV